MSPPRPTIACLIALVNDDAAVLDALKFSLQAQGYGVCSFQRSRDALDSRVIASADCLVIDDAMPDLDGIALLRGLRQRGLTCPAIILADDATLRCRNAASGADATVLEKPLMDDVVGHRIRELLANLQPTLV